MNNPTRTFQPVTATVTERRHSCLRRRACHTSQTGMSTLRFFAAIIGAFALFTATTALAGNWSETQYHDTWSVGTPITTPGQLARFATMVNEGTSFHKTYKNVENFNVFSNVTYVGVSSVKF